MVLCWRGDTHPVILVGLNEDTFRPSMKVILAGTSTGQCVSTLLGVLQTNFGVADCSLTMIQANTANNTNSLDDRVEGELRDWRLGRGAAQNIIPSNNGHSLSEEVLKVWRISVARSVSVILCR